MSEQTKILEFPVKFNYEKACNLDNFDESYSLYVTIMEHVCRERDIEIENSEFYMKMRIAIGSILKIINDFEIN